MRHKVDNQLLTDCLNQFMKIISSFKDYYDGVQSFGTDNNFVFNRTAERRDISCLEGFAKLTNSFIDYGQPYTLDKQGGDYYDDRIIQSNIILGFCGQLYFGYKFDTIEKGKPTKSVVCYTKEEGLAYIESLINNYNVVGFEFTPTPTGSKNQEAWFHSIQSPIFMFPAYANSGEELNLNWDQDIPTSPKELLVNPSLKQLDFQLVKDAYSCFQEIQQFISGVLSENENKPNTLTDKERIEQHGIDPKYGFRTRPKKKKL